MCSDDWIVNEKGDDTMLCWFRHVGSRLQVWGLGLSLGLSLVLGSGWVWANPTTIDLKSKRFLSPAALWGWQLPKKFAQLSAKDQKELLTGKIQVELANRKNEKGKMMLVTMVRGVIKMPPKAVFKTMAEIEKAPEFMPRMFYSKILKKLGPNLFLVRRKIKIAWTVVQMHMRIQLHPEEHRYMFSLVPGMKNDTGDVIGAMHFDPIDGGKHTLMTSFNYSDPGRWVPEFIRRSILRGDLPGIVAAVRKRTLSNYTWKK